MLVKGYRRMPAFGGMTYSDNYKKSIIRIREIKKNRNWYKVCFDYNR